jgi:dihydrofolate reductase
MGKVVVTEFITLDGVFEDPGGAEDFEQGGWSFKFNRGPEGDKFKLDELTAADAQLLGRVTYEGFAKAWPARKDDVGFAEKMNSMPKYVVSLTLQSADWNNSTILRDSWAEDVARLRGEVSGDILVAGSGRLARGLLDHGLVDELRLMTFPVVLGSGRRLFDGVSKPVTLELAETLPAGDALVAIYRKA